MTLAGDCINVDYNNNYTKPSLDRRITNQNVNRVDKTNKKWEEWEKSDGKNILVFKNHKKILRDNRKIDVDMKVDR